MNKKYVITLLISLLIVAGIIFGSSPEKIEVGSAKGVDPQVRGIVKKIDGISKPKNSRKGNKVASSSSNSSGGSDSSDESGQSQSDSSQSADGYKDGTYSGSGTGFKGNVDVSVVISGGKISSIDIVKNVDDAEYFDRAKKIVDDMVKNQTADVDTVSGATYSSNGIIDAVNNALESAVN